MSDQKPLIGNLTFDLTRNRIRIFRTTLHYLGDPNYIQFLINPEELFIAVLGSDKPLPGGTANGVRISSKRMKGQATVEFYSAPLMEALHNVLNILDYNYNYRLTGEIDQVNRVAYFSMKSLKQVTRRTLHGRDGI